MVRSRRCNERPMTSSWDCQVTFLPLIVPNRSERRQADNVLRCMSSRDSFLATCPALRDNGADLSDECNHLKTNNRGCGRENFKCSTQKPVNQVITVFFPLIPSKKKLKNNCPRVQHFLYFEFSVTLSNYKRTIITDKMFTLLSR